MNEALIFTLVIIVAVLFSITLTVVSLRAFNVITQIKRSESFERSEMMRELDQSHVAAFSNAMKALETIHGRLSDDQIAMFNKTMDMVHGPQHAPQTGDEYATDDPRLQTATNWDNTPDFADLFRDPTDDFDPIEPQDDNSNGFAVSVRPGEGLIPNG